MFEVEEVQKTAKKLAVPYKGQVAHVEYGEDRMSGRDWQELNLPLAEGQAEPAYPFNVRFLCRVLIGWDIAVKKKVVPLQPAAIHDLPPRLVGAIAEAVMGDLFPNTTPSSEPMGSLG